MLQVLISNSKCVWVFSCVGRNFIRKVQPRCMSRLNATSCICMFDTNASIVCRRTKRTECMPMCRCGWRGNITKRMKRRRERERMNKLNKHGDVVLVLVLVLKPTHTHIQRSVSGMQVRGRVHYAHGHATCSMHTATRFESITRMKSTYYSAFERDTTKSVQSP